MSVTAGQPHFAAGYACLVRDSIRYEHELDLLAHLPFGRACADSLAPAVTRLALPFNPDRDYRPVGLLRYACPDGRPIGDSPELRVQRTSAIAATLLTAQFSALLTDHRAEVLESLVCRNSRPSTPSEDQTRPMPLHALRDTQSCRTGTPAGAT
ncbi:MAG TPA: hypothetical protein VGL04_09000 [Sporichthyaceae bacterium]